MEENWEDGGDRTRLGGRVGLVGGKEAHHPYHRDLDGLFSLHYQTDADELIRRAALTVQQSRQITCSLYPAPNHSPFSHLYPTETLTYALVVFYLKGEIQKKIKNKEKKKGESDLEV